MKQVLRRRKQRLSTSLQLRGSRALGVSGSLSLPSPRPGLLLGVRCAVSQGHTFGVCSSEEKEGAAGRGAGQLTVPGGALVPRAVGGTLSGRGSAPGLCAQYVLLEELLGSPV